MNAAININGLSHAYRDTSVLDSVSFSVLRGNCFIIIGPNGSGKTTLMRVVAGLQRPSQGEVSVLGEDPRKNPSIYKSMALVPEDEAIYERLTAREFITLAARLAKVADPDASTQRVLETVDLVDSAHRRLGGFSKGMRQRAKVAAALVADPEVLLLDEPLNGADPVQRAALIKLFNQLGDAGKCVLVSSHVLDEVARLGSRVLVIAQGRLAAAGDYHALRDQMDDRPHRILVTADEPRRLAAVLIERAVIDGAHVTDDSVEFNTSDVDGFGRQIAPVARELGIRLRGVNPVDDDLESVFRYLVEGR